jgi:hypothetical protein
MTTPTSSKQQQLSASSSSAAANANALALEQVRMMELAMLTGYPSLADMSNPDMRMRLAGNN